MSSSKDSQIITEGRLRGSEESYFRLVLERGKGCAVEERSEDAMGERCWIRVDTPTEEQTGDAWAWLIEKVYQDRISRIAGDVQQRAETDRVAALERIAARMQWRIDPLGHQLDCHLCHGRSPAALWKPLRIDEKVGHQPGCDYLLAGNLDDAFIGAEEIVSPSLLSMMRERFGMGDESAPGDADQMRAAMDSPEGKKVLAKAAESLAPSPADSLVISRRELQALRLIAATSLLDSHENFSCSICGSADMLDRAESATPVADDWIIHNAGCPFNDAVGLESIADEIEAVRIASEKAVRQAWQGDAKR